MSPTDNEQRKVLFKELMKLRSGPGLTLGRLSKAPVVLDALARHTGKESISPNEAYSVLIARLHGLAPGRTTRALHNAFRLDVNTPDDITTRRADFARAEGKNTDTIENWENEALWDLVQQIMSEPQPSTGTVTPNVGAPVDKAQWVNERVVRTTSYRGKFLDEVNVTRTVRATVDGIDSYLVRFNPKRDMPSDHIRILRHTSCTVEDVEYYANGTIEATVKLPRLLRKDEVHEFSYRIISTEDRFEVAPYSVFSCRLNNPTSQLVVRVQFNATIPTNAWLLPGLTSLQSKTEHSEYPRIEVDSSGFVEGHFNSLSIGHQYGIGWYWPPDLEI